MLGGAVFWSAELEDPEGHRLAEAASDHRLVWLDVGIGTRPDAPPRPPLP